MKELKIPRVTMISSLPPFKGISKYTVGLLQGMAKNEYIEVIHFKSLYPDFLYPGGAKDKSFKPLDLNNVLQQQLLSWYNPLSWINAGFSVKGQIVHIQWWTYVLAPVYIVILLIVKWIRNKIVVITVHNVKPHEGGFIKNLANKLVFLFGDHFIVHADKNKKTFTNSYGISSEKISIVPHGILLPDVPITGISKNEARIELGLPKNAKVILFFGIIREYKGLDILLSAFAILRQKIPEAYLVIAGMPWENWDKYQMYIDRYRLENSIKKNLYFIPENEIELYFKSTDLVALPYTHFDAQSGVAAMALPFGRSIIVTNNGGLVQLVKDKRVVTKPKDKKDLAEKMMLVLNNPNLQEKLEEDSLALSREFSWDAIANKTKAIYRFLGGWKQ